MAITATPIGFQMIINVRNDRGTGSLARKYQDIKPTAADADILSVGQNLAQLQNREFVSIQKTVTYELSED